MKLEDAKQALAKPLANGAIEVSMVGDVDADEAILMSPAPWSGSARAMRRRSQPEQTPVQPAMNDGRNSDALRAEEMLSRRHQLERGHSS